MLPVEHDALLGTGRTLLLVDGREWGQRKEHCDCNTCPSAAVEAIVSHVAFGTLGSREKGERSLLGLGDSCNNYRGVSAKIEKVKTHTHTFHHVNQHVNNEVSKFIRLFQFEGKTDDSLPGLP